MSPYLTGEDQPQPAFLGSSATFIPRPENYTGSDSSSAGVGVGTDGSARHVITRNWNLVS
jgi:hypothetical protein